ncbi:MAG: DUF599 domain-containing protein [Casimicrobiaceae bacterium]
MSPVTEAMGSAWSIAASLFAFLAYEVYVGFRARHDPDGVARSAHASIRVMWVRALSRQPGSEILAVQTLRNSLMSATIVASTAALALMGSVSLGSALFEHPHDTLQAFGMNELLMLLLMTTLFASLVASALAMRLFNHAGFIVSMPVGSPERAALEPVAEAYLRRAGQHYSRGLRGLFMVAPMLAGLVWPLLMPLGTAGLLIALSLFDRAPARARAADR